MKFSTTATIIFLRLAGLAWAGCEDSADGFASLNGGTTGGKGGTVVTVNNQADLVKYAGSDGKYVIKVSGKINISPKGTEVAVANDKTIIGIGAKAEISGGGFKIINRRNVIVRNLRIGGTDGGEELDWDGIQVDTSTNIWIDHCIFETIGDGGIDLRKDTDFFTVSNTWLKGVNKAFGIGWTENVQNSGTIHHTYFDGTTQRNPSADNLLHAHLYNNYLRGCKSYGHYARGATDARIENVYFEDCKNPLQADEGATLTALGNVFDGTSGTVAKDQGKSFDPAGFYEYKLDAVDDVPAIVLKNAGPRDGIWVLLTLELPDI
ncbi:pectin lyase fold/virulence factor [Chaetomium tenue]|uniref:Pectin lyase fold/virulence factor n=1 Tax=Chaetomium tenue TaxID=1854479 RepID=A0ACB7NVD3_9PEZI|nr:pectin lyase fold/virulence factor [Chaetomium globosum]